MGIMAVSFWGLNLVENIVENPVAPAACHKYNTSGETGPQIAHYMYLLHQTGLDFLFHCAICHNSFCCTSPNPDFAAVLFCTKVQQES